MDEKRLFINTTPGRRFLDKLTGKTKVRTFLMLIILLISTWDMRLIFPVFVLGWIALISLRPDWKKVWGVMAFVIVVNLFNLFLVWVVRPDYGLSLCGGSTVIFKITDYYIVTQETLWYFLVRFMKLLGTFTVSLTFIQCITPSEMAAGLYSCKVPYKICTIFSIAFRYIPDISRDFQNIKISMQMRGMELDSKKTTLWTRLKQNVLILVPLVITSFDRVGNIANGMDLRGYGKNKTRTYYSEHEDTPGDKKMKIFYLLLLALFVFSLVWRILFPVEYEVWCPWIH